MKKLAITILLLSVLCRLTAQIKKVYTIPADSVKITYCDSAELIIENHTQNIPGFLFNTGNGRTIFKRAAQKLNDSIYLVGADTIKLSSNAWVQGGNAFGATGILGTLDNTHLDLYTHDTARMRLTNAGNLLLGSMADGGQILQVKGNSRFNGSLAVDVDNTYTVDFTNPFGIGYAALRFTNNSSGHQYAFTSTGDVLGIQYQANGAGQPSNPFVTFTPALTTFGNGGNHSIYINGPFSSSYNTSGYGGLAVAGLWNADGFGPKLDFVVGDHSLGTPVIGGGIFMTKTWLGGDATNLKTSMTFNLRQDAATTAEVMRLLANGNVLMGTTVDGGQLLQVNGSSYFAGAHTATGAVTFSGLTSDNTQTRLLVGDANGNLYYRDASTLAANEPIRSSLAVNGPIKAKKLTLDAGDWPDYVFDSTYRLPALTAVRSYLSSQHHLPGVPSAAEVQQKGIDLGENQAVLLKKIEELTLYMVKQDEQITELKEQVAALKQLVLTKLNSK